MLNAGRSGQLKIALVSPRFLSTDMRGGEEFIRTLFENIGSDSETWVLTSDCIDVLAEHSPKGRRINQPDSAEAIRGNVRYLASVPFFSFSFHYLRYPFVGISRKLRIEPYSCIAIDLMRIYGWGPYLPKIRTEIENMKPEVVHAAIFPTTSAYLAMKASKRTGIPFIFTPFYHYKLPEFNKSAILKKMIASSNAVVACTELERQELIRIGSKPENTFVIPLALDTRRYPKQEGNRVTSKQELGVEGKFVILAHPWSGKGIISVLEAVHELTRTGLKNVTLMTIGEPDRRYLAYKQRILRINKDIDVRDIGWVETEKKRCAFDACDVFVMPSLNDSFGMSYLDAWYSSKPVIAASNSFAEEIIDDGENGLLADVNISREVADAIREIYDNPSLAEKMGNKGRSKTLSEYSPSLLVKRYKAVYEYVIKK